MAITILGAEPFGLDNKEAVFGDFSACQLNQTGPHVIRQIGRIPDIKAKLNGRGDLVDMLAPRSRRPDEMQFDFILMNGN